MVTVGGTSACPMNYIYKINTVSSFCLRGMYRRNISLLILVVFPGGDLFICSSASSQKIEAEQSSIWMKAGKREIKRTEVFFFLAWFHVAMTSWLVKRVRKYKPTDKYKQQFSKFECKYQKVTLTCSIKQNVCFWGVTGQIYTLQQAHSVGLFIHLYKQCCKCPGSGGNSLITPCRTQRRQMDKCNFGKADIFGDRRVCFTQGVGILLLLPLINLPHLLYIQNIYNSVPFHWQRVCVSLQIKFLYFGRSQKIVLSKKMNELEKS